MKKSLLLLGVIAALAIGAPAYSQYIYMDVNGDGVNTTADLLTSSSTHVDIWLNTNHNKAGATVLCNDGTTPRNIGSYDIIVHSQGSGSVSYGTWKNNMTGYAVLSPQSTAGPDAGVGYTSSGGYDPPGLYKLGSFPVTVTGNPQMIFLTQAPVGINDFGTGFGSLCSGTDNPNTITLGLDFFDNDGTAAGTPVESTTWGKIKQLYR